MKCIQLLEDGADIGAEHYVRRASALRLPAVAATSVPYSERQAAAPQNRETPEEDVAKDAATYAALLPSSPAPPAAATPEAASGNGAGAAAAPAEASAARGAKRSADEALAGGAERGRLKGAPASSTALVPVAPSPLPLPPPPPLPPVIASGGPAGGLGVSAPAPGGSVEARLAAAAAQAAQRLQAYRDERQKLRADRAAAQAALQNIDDALAALDARHAQ